MGLEEARAPMPNNPYMFNGSRTAPRLKGGKTRRRTRKTRRSRKNRMRK